MEDLHRIWPHRWLNPKLKVRRSNIDGIGTFAMKKIRKGEVIAVFGGVSVPVSEVGEYQRRVGAQVGLQINEMFFLCPTTYDELKKTGNFNHSCEPNMGLLDSVTCVAIRDIKKGKEVVGDYAFWRTTSPNQGKIFFGCNCGSRNCRGSIRIDDWKRKDLQKRYGRYFSPYIKRKFGYKD